MNRNICILKTLIYHDSHKWILGMTSKTKFGPTESILSAGQKIFNLESNCFQFLAEWTESNSIVSFKISFRPTECSLNPWLVCHRLYATIIIFITFLDHSPWRVHMKSGINGTLSLEFINCFLVGCFFCATLYIYLYIISSEYKIPKFH